MPDITNPAAAREERLDAATLRVTRQSAFTGAINTMDLPLTAEQEHAWRTKTRPIDVVLPHLTPDQREFLLTGTTQEEWDAAFPPEEEEEDGYAF